MKKAIIAALMAYARWADDHDLTPIGAWTLVVAVADMAVLFLAPLFGCRSQTLLGVCTVILFISFFILTVKGEQDHRDPDSY